MRKDVLIVRLFNEKRKIYGCFIIFATELFTIYRYGKEQTDKRRIRGHPQQSGFYRTFRIQIYKRRFGNGHQFSSNGIQAIPHPATLSCQRRKDCTHHAR